MVVYHHQRLEVKGESESGVVSDWSHEKTELIHKIYRRHQNVSIIDGVFISNIMREYIGIKDKGKIYHIVKHNQS